MRLLTRLGLVALLVLAGCAAGPFSGPSTQEESATVGANNSANVTYTFEVSVVELPANVTIRRDDGVNVTTDIPQGLSSHSSGEHHTFTAVELPETARLHGRYTLAPGEENRSVIKEFPPNFAVVIVIYQDENEIIEWVSANCDDLALVGLRVTTHPDSAGRASATYQCV